jgi:hypothetical protein
VLELDVGYSVACTAETTCFHSTPLFITLCFSADDTFAPPPSGEVEGDAGDALDLARRVDLRVDGALLARRPASRSPSARRNRRRR